MTRRSQQKGHRTIEETGALWNNLQRELHVPLRHDDESARSPKRAETEYAQPKAVVKRRSGQCDRKTSGSRWLE